MPVRRHFVAATAIVTAIALVTTAPMSAQRAARRSTAPTSPATTYGVIAGVNIANFSGDLDGENRFGVMLGATARIPLGSQLAFQPELHYTQKGTRIESALLDGRLRLHYLEAPLHLRYELPNSSAIKPYLLAGPTFALRVGCTARSNARNADCDDVGPLFNLPVEIDLGVRRFDYGLSLGGGLDFPVAGRTMTAGLRYGYGLAEVFREGNPRNRTVQFFGGVRF
ncbi:MAG: PorT family protein [Gemmatimonadaceae bacterium]|nr:PorT family protein [Gemmatimonadaceae bacterium]